MRKLLLWPTVQNQNPGFVVALGRLLHWLGMAAAVVILVVVAVFGLLALAWRGASGIYGVDPDAVLRILFYCALAAFVYFAGRGLRYLLSRE